MGATQSASKKRVTNHLKTKLKGKVAQKQHSVKTVSKSTKSTKSAKDNRTKTASKFSDKKQNAQTKAKTAVKKVEEKPSPKEERMTLFEDALLKEINRYRLGHKLRELRSVSNATGPIEAICKASLKKRKLDPKEVKKQQKEISVETFVNENIFYIFKFNKKIEKVENFVQFVMAKWQAQSNTDNNLKNGAIETCNLIVMKQDEDICVYMTSYKGDKENQVQATPVEKKPAQPAKAQQPQKKVLPKVESRREVLVDTKKQVK